MAQYILKSVLLAEIEKKKKLLPWGSCASQISMECNCKNEAYDDVISLIDTLEVKEVDLEKEIKEEYLGRRCYSGRDNMLVILNEPQFNAIAKHFFEFGLLSTITEEDCKLIWNIGDEIPNMPEEEFYKELLKRYKAKKGEEV